MFKNYQNTPEMETSPVQQDSGMGVTVTDIFDICVANKWWIISATLISALLGFGYAYFSEPIYEADTLIQIEDAKTNPYGNLQADNIFEVKSQAAAEIEVLRSRLVVGQAVDTLQLDQRVAPKYLPLIGSWAPRILAKTPWSDFPSWRGYVISGGTLRLGYLKVPDAIRNVRFSVILTSRGYRLQGPSEENLGESVLGEPLEFMLYQQRGQILVSNASGKIGSEFYVVLRSKLPIIQQLQSSIMIMEAGRQSGMLRSTYEGSEPREIVRILNEIANIYVRQNVDRKAAEAEKSLAFLSRQLPDLKNELEESERIFNKFRSSQGFFDLSGEASSILSRTTQLKVQLVELKQKKIDLERRYTAQHPAMQNLETQTKGLAAELASLEGQAKILPDREQDMLRLMRDVKVNNELYTSLLNNAQQLRLVKEGKVGNVRLIDPAVVSDYPIKPVKLKIVALSTAIGFLFGIGLSLFRFAMRPSIRMASEIESALGLSVYSTVPFSRLQTTIESQQNPEENKKLLSLKFPNDPAIESLRSLRTAMQFIMGNASNPIVMITGPTPGIGKSFISSNLAVILASAGKKVLLIDGDMRKGHIHKYLGLDRGHGFSELISGNVKLEQAIRKNVFPCLDFISTGQIPPNPAELLMTDECRELLKIIYTGYDHVIIDSPPVLAVSDTTAMAPSVGRIMILARSNVTTIKELGETVKRIRMAGGVLPGVIFNGLDVQKSRYGYGYEYDFYRHQYGSLK